MVDVYRVAEHGSSFYEMHCLWVCECVFLIDYPKINENRSQAHVRAYGFKFCKIRPFLEGMFNVQAKQIKQKKKTLVTPAWVRTPIGSAAIKESCQSDSLAK